MKKIKPMLENKTREFIEKLEASGAPPLYTLTPQEARKVLDAVQDQYPVETKPAHIEDIEVKGGPTGTVSLRIIRPPTKEKLPVILYIHGAGWILGGKKSFDRLARDIAIGAHAALVFVDYSLSPEAPFPVALEQQYAALEYVAQHGDKHNIDSSRLAIAGDSVGGNMAAVNAILAKERGGPKIDFQLLFYPVTDARMSTQSYHDFAEGPWLTKKAMEWFWDAYEPDKNARSIYTMSPINATLDQLRGLPPALVITDENDVLRDEGEAYAHRLMEAGVNTVAIRFLGTHHDFVLLNALHGTPAPRAALEFSTLQLREALHPKK